MKKSIGAAPYLWHLFGLRPELAARAWSGEREAALIFRDGFDSDRMNASVIDHVSLPSQSAVVAALGWSECAIGTIIMGRRNDTNLVA